MTAAPTFEGSTAVTPTPTEEAPPSLQELAERIRQARDHLFEGQTIVELCVYACTSHYDGGMRFESALQAFELLYRHIDGIAGQLGGILDDLD